MEQLRNIKEKAGPVVRSIWNSEERRQTLKRKLQELMSREADMYVELENAEMLFGKKRKYEVENWLGNVGRVKNEVQGLNIDMEKSRWSFQYSNQVERLTNEISQLIEIGQFEGGLVHDVNENRGDALLTTKLVGQAFQINMDKIWACLMKDEVFSIGIYGMGGVGKTSSVTHIHNQFLERFKTFHVFWITASQDFIISKMQNLIAKAIHLDLSNEDDENKRAAKLSKALIKKQNFVLIIDDLWNHFTLEKVGIPVRMNGCKLILTTRSLEVCQRMGCQEKFKVEPLSEEEAWTLFMEKLGHDIILSSEIEQIAKSVARECAGLPLGIVTMARSMRGVDDMHEWRNALEELKESKVGQCDMENEVFQILKFSYYRLNDSVLQQCFLYCALFPEDYEIRREDLIEYLIDEEIIRMKSRQAELDKGHTILNKLENACLLESCVDNEKHRCVKMHDLIRDMALQIQRVNSQVMVEAGAMLNELPAEEKWAKDLVRVSLMDNGIEEIPPSHSPICPNLSTLLLCHNWDMKFVANPFFKQLPMLKVLDLCFTNIQGLPDSISDLVSLTALLLRYCFQLKCIPSLAKLRALRKLHLSYSGVAEVPQGMELLSNLRDLNLCGCRIKELPNGILPNLHHLQVLKLPDWDVCSSDFSCVRTTMIRVNPEEVAFLMKLEVLECHFNNLDDFKNYLIRAQGRQPSTYHHLITPIYDDNLYGFGEAFSCLSACKGLAESAELSKQVWLCECRISSGQDFLVLPENIQELVLARCHIATSLWHVSSLEYANELKSLLIGDCDGIKRLFPLFWFSPTLFPCNGSFSHLKKIVIDSCDEMRNLFPQGLLRNLQNLEQIEVRYCERMENIIASEDVDSDDDDHSRDDCYCDDDDDDDDDDEDTTGRESNSSSKNNFSNEFSLQKLRLLKLICLRKLKSICGGKLICNSLQEITVSCCWKLKRMPLSLPLLENGQPSPPPSLKKISVRPKECWESLEWDHPNSKHVLLPLYTTEE